MLHNFMTAAREAGLTMAEYRSDPVKAAAAHVRFVEKYDPDGILIDFDTATLAAAVGVPIDDPEDLPSRVHSPLLPSLADLSGLGVPDIARSGRVNVWLETCRLVKSRFGDEKFVRGNCDQAPFSLASMVRGLEGWFLDLAAEEEGVVALLEWCAGACRQFLRLMAGTGVDMVSNGDSAAGPALVSPRLYRKYAFPHERRLAAEAHRLGLPYVLHLCGDAGPILADMADTGADGLELDSKTAIGRIHSVCAGRTALFGTLDPSSVLTLGTPAAVEAETRKILETYANSPRLVLNAGCALPAETPEANIRAFIRTARADPMNFS